MADFPLYAPVQWRTTEYEDLINHLHTRPSTATIAAECSLPVRGVANLQAATRQGAGNLMQHGFRDNFGAAQIPAALLRSAGSQVAGASLAMLRLAGRRQSETLFGTFVGLLFGHSRTRKPTESLLVWKPRIVEGESRLRKGSSTKFMFRENGAKDDGEVEPPKTRKETKDGSVFDRLSRICLDRIATCRRATKIGLSGRAECGCDAGRAYVGQNSLCSPSYAIPPRQSFFTRFSCSPPNLPRCCCD